MSNRKLFTLSLLTWSKFFVYILPLACVLFTPWYMIPALASVGWGIRKSRTRFERGCGCVMLVSWLIWGWHMGPWVPVEQREGGVMLIGLVLYLLVEESDYNNKDRRKPDEWE